MSQPRFPLFDFSLPRIRLLHYTWFAFFLTFVIWLGHAPLMPLIKSSLGLTDAQTKAFLILNVALTIPARIIIGILVDKFGPRRAYSTLLACVGLLCIAFATAQTFNQLAILRFLLGLTGAGFVIGIRLVSEWFPAREVGLAEGIYGGWGNFGAAFAAFSLPAIAAIVGGPNGWRIAIALAGSIALVYSVLFYRGVRDTPKGATYFRPKKSGALEITSKGDFWFYLLMNLPMYLALTLLAWRLSPSGLDIISATTTVVAYVVIALLALMQISQVVRVNRHVFTHEVPEHQRYKFRQVAILNIAYMASFGSELAVASMLPLFFVNTFHVGPLVAGLLSGCFVVMNLLARPGAGWLSDRMGRRRVLSLALGGQTLGYFLLSQVGGDWWIPAAILVVVCCSLFVQAGCGAVYSVVPLIQRRMTGQIAGMTGAYGNIGGVVFLTVLSFVTPHVFFLCIAGVSLFAFLTAQALLEPRGHMAEVREDGTVELIEVS